MCSTKRLIKCFVPRQFRQLMNFIEESLNRDLIIWMGNLQMSVPFRILSLGSSFSPEESPPSWDKAFTWCWYFGSQRGRRLKVLPPSALLSVQHVSPLLTGIQAWRLIPCISKFEPFQVPGVWTFLIGVYLCMQEVARSLWSANPSTGLASPKCVDL